MTCANEEAEDEVHETRASIAIVDFLPYVPFQASLEFMLLAWNGGEMLDARRAHELGMVNRVVPDADLMNEAIRWAEMLKKIPPMYIKAVKYGHYKAMESKTVRDEREYLNFIWPQEVSEDSREGRHAFKEKREPRFKGR